MTFPHPVSSPSVLFIGRATLDVVYSLDRFPSQDTKVFAHAMHAAPGGPATNAAITHALLGGRAQLMTAIGSGPWASPVRSELERLGIGLIDLATGTSYQAPLTTILVNKAEATRTIVNPPASDVALMRPEVWEPTWGTPPALVLTDGFHLPETLPLLRALKTAGVPICLDGGSWKSGTDELANLLSVAICSERFALPRSPLDAEAAIAWFRDRGVPHIAITRGSRPILVCDRDHRFEINIAPVDAVDTTGAGDVLHGAFCFEFAKTGGFEHSLRTAAEMATCSCCHMGIKEWVKATEPGVSAGAGDETPHTS